MVGTVLSWFVLEATGNFWVGFLIVPVICFILGALIQRVVIQPIRGAAALSIVATFGVSLILQEVVRMTFGATPRRMLPLWWKAPSALFGIQYDIYRLYAAGVLAGRVGAFFLFLNYTKSRDLDEGGATRPGDRDGNGNSGAAGLRVDVRGRVCAPGSAAQMRRTDHDG